MSYTKSEAIKIAVNAAKKYQSELLNRNLLFICTDKHKRVSTFEVSFYDRNFRHLTGLETDDSKISAKDFFNRCVDKHLGISERDIEFRDDGFTEDKLDVLPLIMTKNLGQPNMLGKYDGSRINLVTDRLVGRDRFCIGFDIDLISNNYVPNTIIQDDTRNITLHPQYRVILIFRKHFKENTYTELVYKARKKVEWDRIIMPKEYQYLEY